MQNIVSFETAKRLRDAGFPQPNVERGQSWYNREGSLQIIAHDPTYPKEFNSLIREHAWIFAPTATDILRSLPGYNLAFATENGWHCFFMSIDGVIYAENSHKDNPAEAAAIAYLEMKKNESEND